VYSNVTQIYEHPRQWTIYWSDFMEDIVVNDIKEMVNWFTIEILTQDLLELLERDRKVSAYVRL